MNKAGWLSILVATLVLVFGVAAKAQQPKKVARIGYLAADSRAPTREAFRQGLKDFGYVEGQSILIEWRFTEDKPDRFPEFAADLARLKVDAIVLATRVPCRFSSVQRRRSRSSWQPMRAILWRTAS
jgi:putative tryptophan/tyrosine transport system substrate-binding protein